MYNLERLLYIVNAFIYSGAVVSLGTKEGAPIILKVLARYSVPLVFLSTALFVVKRGLHKKALGIVLSDKALSLLSATVVLSVTWSVSPTGSLRQAILFLGGIGIGVYWALRFSLATQLRLLEYAFIIIALLSIVTVFLFPEYGLQSHGSESVWKGVYNNRNKLGRFMAIAVIIAMYRGGGSGTVRRWAKIFFFSVPLYFTGSRSAAVLAVFGISAYPIVQQFRLAPKLLISVGAFGSIGMAGITAWVVSNFSSIVQSIGRDVTLSGRTFIWLESLEAFYQQPVLGYGMGGFYMLLEQGYVTSDWTASAHNAYLEVVLSTGMVGLILLIIYLFSNLSQSLKWIRRTDGRIGYWPLVYLLFVIAYAFIESVLFRHFNLMWAIVVSTTFCMRVGLNNNK